jgi:hypothetical protein
MTPAPPRPKPQEAFTKAPLWYRALNWSAVTLLIGIAVSTALSILRSIHPPFATLHAMAEVAVFMEFHDRGVAGPPFISTRWRTNSLQVPCFRDGAPDLALAPGADCESGLFSGESSYTSMIWSAANTSGVVMPAFLLHTSFGARLLSYAEAPCQAVRDFDGVVLPARPGARGLDWLVQEMGDIRKAFDCDGNGGLRAGQPGRWAETTFRLHLYDASGRVVSTLDIAPGWTKPRRESTARRSFSPADWSSPQPGLFGWLPDQFPPAARLDPPSPRSHSSP